MTTVALVARDQQCLDAVAAQRIAEGVTARGFAAGVQSPKALTTALDAAAETLAPIEALLRYNSVTQLGFTRPVLDTMPDGLDS